MYLWNREEFFLGPTVKWWIASTDIPWAARTGTFSSRWFLISRRVAPFPVSVVFRRRTCAWKEWLFINSVAVSINWGNFYNKDFRLTLFIGPLTVSVCSTVLNVTASLSTVSSEVSNKDKQSLSNKGNENPLKRFFCCWRNKSQESFQEQHQCHRLSPWKMYVHKSYFLFQQKRNVPNMSWNF